MNRTLYVIIIICMSLAVQAAEAGQNLYTTGKIHVVISVLVTIFIGIVIFLLVLEKKVSNLEKQLRDTPDL